MTRNEIDKAPPKQISKRWPGAGSRGVRKAIVTNRNKKVKVTLPSLKQRGSR